MEGKRESIYRITDFDEAERPRERLARLGAQSLSNAELIAILLRVGVPGENAVQVGQRLLQTYGGISGLQRADFKEVCNQHGLGTAKVAQIKAAIELGRRLTLESPEEKPAIHSPADAAALVQYEMSALEQEELRVMLLDTRNRVMDIVPVYIRRNAASIVVIHNHPSGDPTPSPDDVAITRGIIQAGKLLDVDVLDHLVIGRGKFVSLKERGLGFA